MLITSLLVLLPLWVNAQSTTPSPTLSLPWNTYTATYIPHTSGIADNVRFGDAPTGSMRFGKPSTPTSAIVDPTGVIQCPSVPLSKLSGKGVGVPYLGQPNTGDEDINQTEDCLFLDIYVPSAIFKDGNPTVQVPIIVWFYGGAYIAGSKAGNNTNNPLYTGVGALNAAQAFEQDVIFVAGNYRLGAYGWLAGTYMENQGAPNAGLYDQRLLLEWVQTWTTQIGGNVSAISAWGQSAGASSILHHLVMDDGQGNPLDPIFKKAILQSPAFEMQWDQNGSLTQAYEDFIAASVPSCTSYDLSCLRELNDTVLADVNTNFTVAWWEKYHQFPFGPAVDRDLIKHLPVNLFAQGHYWHGLESILVSHVEDEASIFVNWSYGDTDQAVYSTFVSDFIPQPTLSTERSSIMVHYPVPTVSSPVMQRLNELVRDSSFTCNTRQLFDAYQSINVPTYMMYVGLDFKNFKAVHGTDLLPTFWNAEVNFTKFIFDVANAAGDPISPLLAEAISTFFGHPSYFARKYQSYLVSHAIYGTPNNGSYQKHPWPTATPTVSGTDTLVSNVQKAQATLFPTPDFFAVIVDEINTSDACDFWKELAAEIDVDDEEDKTHVEL